MFAFFWGLSGSLALPGAWRVLALTLVSILTLALGAVCFGFFRRAKQFPKRSSTPDKHPVQTTAYRLSVAAMVVAIPVIARILASNGRADAVMPAVAIVVGLHFFGLVPAFRSNVFAAVAVCFCVLGVAALFLPVQLGGAFRVREAAVGLGCAATIWLFSALLVFRTLRSLRLERSRRRAGGSSRNDATS